MRRKQQLHPALPDILKDMSYAQGVKYDEMKAMLEDLADYAMEKDDPRLNIICLRMGILSSKYAPDRVIQNEIARMTGDDPLPLD